MRETTNVDEIFCIRRRQSWKKVLGTLDALKPKLMAKFL
jgi:hypothetical protein